MQRFHLHLGAGSMLLLPVLADALDRPISADRLVLERSASGRETLTFVSKDPTFLFPRFGSGDDPAIAGARIELFSASGPSIATFDLPDSVCILFRCTSVH